MPRYERDLRARARVFAIEVYRLAKDVRQRYPVLRNYADQLCDAAGSVGANLSESDGLNSRRELAARYSIALKESKEAGGVQRTHSDVYRRIEETATPPES
jgi:four helix bundle protein